LSVGENLHSEDDRRDRRVILQRMDQLDEAHHDSTWIIDGKNPSVERLRKWRQATLTVNATRRFRYTSDLRKLEERNKFPSSPKARLRASTCVLCAVQIFKNAVSGITFDKHLQTMHLI
jgi:hypothetical protein